jgi:hypothetical protein
MRFVSSLKPTEVAQRNCDDIQEALEKNFKHVLSVLREAALKISLKACAEVIDDGVSVSI